MGEKLAADIDPTEVGGLADDLLAQQLGVSEDEIRHDIQALIDLGYIEHRPAESAMKMTGSDKSSATGSGPTVATAI
jgi:DNA-binding transcriptional MocR family regulator